MFPLVVLLGNLFFLKWTVGSNFYRRLAVRVIQCSCAVVSGNVFSFIGCVFVRCCLMKLVLWMPEHHSALSKYTTRVTVLKFVLWPGLAPHERHLAHESRHVLQHKRNVSNVSFMTLHPRYCQSWEFC
jgi:hypothetical protein